MKKRPLVKFKVQSRFKNNLSQTKNVLGKGIVLKIRHPTVTK